MSVAWNWPQCEDFTPRKSANATNQGFFFGTADNQHTPVCVFHVKVAILSAPSHVIFHLSLSSPKNTAWGKDVGVSSLFERWPHRTQEWSQENKIRREGKPVKRWIHGLHCLCCGQWGSILWGRHRMGLKSKVFRGKVAWGTKLTHTSESSWGDQVSLTNRHSYSWNMELQEQDHFIHKDDLWIWRVKEPETRKALLHFSTLFSVLKMCMLGMS